MLIERSFRALLIHLRNAALLPLTSTGEQPNPSNGRIAFRALSSVMNHGAQAGRTGKPNRAATRYNTKTGSLSHKTVRAPSRSAPGFVLAKSEEIATRWRTGRSRFETTTLPRKHCASVPSDTIIGERPVK